MSNVPKLLYIFWMAHNLNCIHRFDAGAKYAKFINIISIKYIFCMGKSDENVLFETICMKIWINIAFLIANLSINLISNYMNSHRETDLPLDSTHRFDMKTFFYSLPLKSREVSYVNCDSVWNYYYSYVWHMNIWKLISANFDSLRLLPSFFLFIMN